MPSQEFLNLTRMGRRGWLSPAGGGEGGGPDSSIASTIFSILCITGHISTGKPLLSSFSYAGCLQTVITVCCRRNYWFHRLLVFPALFSCSFSTPLHPRQRGTVVSHVSSGFCRCVSQERHGQTIPVQDIQGHGLSMPPNPIA